MSKITPQIYKSFTNFKIICNIVITAFATVIAIATIEPNY